MLKLKYRGIEINGFCKDEEKNITHMVICEKCADKYKEKFGIDTSELEFDSEVGCGIVGCENEDWDVNEVDTAWIELSTDEVIFTEE